MNFTKISATKNNSADIPIIFYNVHERTRVIILRKHFFFRDGKNIMDQAGCFENTLPLPQRGKYSYFAKAGGLKNRLNAERTCFLIVPSTVGRFPKIEIRKAYRVLM